MPLNLSLIQIVVNRFSFLSEKIFTSECLEFLLKCVVEFHLKRTLTNLLALTSRLMSSFDKVMSALYTLTPTQPTFNYLQRHHLHGKP